MEFFSLCFCSDFLFSKIAPLIKKKKYCWRKCMGEVDNEKTNW